LTGHYVAVWEGVDGSGKTTLMAETAGRLRSMGYSVESYKTPSNTSTGLFAKDYGNREDTDPLTRMLVFLANTADDSKVMKKIIERKNRSSCSSTDTMPAQLFTLRPAGETFLKKI
jgi:thymidylate kinase